MTNPLGCNAIRPIHMHWAGRTHTFVSLSCHLDTPSKSHYISQILGNRSWLLHKRDSTRILRYTHICICATSMLPLPRVHKLTAQPVIENLQKKSKPDNKIYYGRTILPWSSHARLQVQIKWIPTFSILWLLYGNAPRVLSSLTQDFPTPSALLVNLLPAAEQNNYHLERRRKEKIDLYMKNWMTKQSFNTTYKRNWPIFVQDREDKDTRIGRNWSSSKHIHVQEYYNYKYFWSLQIT